MVAAPVSGDPASVASVVGNVGFVATSTRPIGVLPILMNGPVAIVCLSSTGSSDNEFPSSFDGEDGSDAETSVAGDVSCVSAPAGFSPGSDGASIGGWSAADIPDDEDAGVAGEVAVVSLADVVAEEESAAEDGVAGAVVRAGLDVRAGDVDSVVVCCSVVGAVVVCSADGLAVFFANVVLAAVSFAIFADVGLVFFSADIMPGVVETAEETASIKAASVVVPDVVVVAVEGEVGCVVVSGALVCCVVVTVVVVVVVSDVVDVITDVFVVAVVVLIKAAGVSSGVCSSAFNRL